MPKDDYDKMVFLILGVLYQNFKAGTDTKPDEVYADTLDINHGYWLNIIREIDGMGLIAGISIAEDIHGVERVRGLERIRITNDGIHYLKENETMAKVYKALKEAKEWIPGL